MRVTFEHRHENKGFSAYRETVNVGQPPFWSGVNTSWKNYRGPSNSTVEVSSQIVESIFKFVGIDPDTHFAENLCLEILDDSGETKQKIKKKKKPVVKRKEKEECLDLVANYTSGSDTEEPVKIISSDSELQNPSKKVKKTVKMVLCNSPAEKGKYEQARENNIKEFNTQYQALFGKPVVQMKTCPK